MFILIKKVSKEKNDEFLSNHILACCSNIYLIKMAATNYLIIEEQIKTNKKNNRITIFICS